MFGFREERQISRTRIEVPVSTHPIDSVNLKDPRLGISDALSDFVARAGVGKGRLHLTLDPAERHSAVTVNEYETLLMKHDLAEVLRNPLSFVAKQYHSAMKDPRAVPSKTLGYAKYDFVRVMNIGLDTLRLRGSVVEKLLARTLAVPAVALLPDAPLGEPAGVGTRRRQPRHRRRHLPEPHPRAVAALAPGIASARRHAHRTPLRRTHARRQRVVSWAPCRPANASWHSMPSAA